MEISLEDQICELRQKNVALQRKNNALVQKVQFFKMTAAQREDEKIDLMKEINQLRLSMSRYRSTSANLDSALDSAMQEFGERTLTRLVEVSSDITRSIEIMKTYIRQKQEAESATASERQSVLDSPRDRNSNKVLRVVPMIRGRSIVKPYILLSPIDASAHMMTNNNTGNNQEDDAEVEEEEQTPPQHVLQDVYIPLHRIDAETVNLSRRSRLENDSDNADISLESNENAAGDSDTSETNEVEGQDESEEDESEAEDNYNAMRSLNTLPEDAEIDNWSPQVLLNREPIARNTENPLEGPSWLLEDTSTLVSTNTLEPDSTTDASQMHTAGVSLHNSIATGLSTPIVLSQQSSPENPAVSHTPTRRVKHKHSRLSSPRVSLALLDEVWPQPDASTSENNGNVKDPTKVFVMVAKMRAEDLLVRRRNSISTHVDCTPQRQRVPLEAPSPNGSTLDAGPIVMDNADKVRTLQRETEIVGSSHDRSHCGFVTGRSRERSVRTKRSGSVHDRTERDRSEDLSSNEEEVRSRKTSRASRFQRHGSSQTESEQSSEERSVLEVSVRERERVRPARKRSTQKRSLNERCIRSVQERQEQSESEMQDVRSVRETLDMERPAQESRDESVRMRRGMVRDNRRIGSVQEIISARGDLVHSLENMEESLNERSSGRSRARRSSEESEAETQELGMRTKRSRKIPTSYKEKPLNRKLRR